MRGYGRNKILYEREKNICIKNMKIIKGRKMVYEKGAGLFRDENQKGTKQEKFNIKYRI